MAAADVAEQPLGRRVDPADDPRRVEDVARDADALQGPLDVAADSQASDHDREYGLAAAGAVGVELEIVRVIDPARPRTSATAPMQTR